MDDFFKDLKPVKREDSPQEDLKPVKHEDPPEKDKLIAEADEPSVPLVKPEPSPAAAPGAKGGEFFHDLKPVRADDSPEVIETPSRPAQSPSATTQPKPDKPKMARPTESGRPPTRTDEHANEHEEDDDDDETDDEVESDPSQLFSAYVAQKDWKGFFRHFGALTWGVLSNPKQFFAKMPKSGGLFEPVVYLVTAATINALLYAILRLNVLGFFSSFFVSLISVGVGAVIAHYAFEKLGGKGSLEATVRVFAFSRATLLFAWICIGDFPIGGIIAGLYSIYLNLVGIEKVHKLKDRKTVAMVLVVLAAIGFAIKCRFSI